MKAVGYKVPGPIAEDASLVDIDLPRPVAAGYDILVEVKAVSVLNHPLISPEQTSC